MGTNFYIATKTGRLSKIHIGKRSAAGLYCWDCRLTLCKDGEEFIHQSKSRRSYQFGLSGDDAFKRMLQEAKDDFYEACPKCGKTPRTETLTTSSAGKELGFNKEVPTKKSGVTSCCSFTWATNQEQFESDAILSTKYSLKIQYGVVDEYGQKMSLEDFKQMLEFDCPVRYYHSIGKEFS